MPVKRKGARKSVVESKRITGSIEKTEKAMDAMKKHIHAHHPDFRRSPLAGVWAFIMWVVGLLVALAVGFGMADRTLTIPGLGIVTVVAGWIVIVLIILGVILKIIDVLSR